MKGHFGNWAAGGTPGDAERDVEECVTDLFDAMCEVASGKNCAATACAASAVVSWSFRELIEQLDEGETVDESARFFQSVLQATIERLDELACERKAQLADA